MQALSRRGLTSPCKALSGQTKVKTQEYICIPQVNTGTKNTACKAIPSCRNQFSKNPNQAGKLRVFIPTQVVPVSFPHWLGSNLTVFPNWLVLKESCKENEGKREGICYPRLSSSGGLGRGCLCTNKYGEVNCLHKYFTRWERLEVWEICRILALTRLSTSDRKRHFPLIGNPRQRKPGCPIS